MAVSLYLPGVTKDAFVNDKGIIRGNPEITTVRSINLYYRCIDGRFRKFTEQKIKECDWIECDPKRKIYQRIDPKVRGAEHINLILDELSAKLDKVIRDKHAAGDLIYMNDLEAVMPKSKPAVEDPEKEKPLEEKSFFEFFQRYTDFDGTGKISLTYGDDVAALSEGSFNKMGIVPGDKITIARANYTVSVVKDDAHIVLTHKSAVSVSDHPFRVCPKHADKNFTKTLVHLNAFEKHYKYGLDWPVIKDKFYASFIYFMTEVYVNPTTKNIGLFNSTLVRDTRCIKQVCRDARKIGIEVPIDYETFERPKTISDGRRRAAISETIIDELNNFDFYNKEHYPPRTNLDRVVMNIHEIRDEYTFRFDTGLRLSDATKMLNENVVNGFSQEGVIKVLDFVQKKTLNNNIVPLTDRCLAILAKYEGKKFSALPRFSNGYYNRICKLMFRIIGRNEKVTITRMKGDKMITEIKEEWELLTSHSARHSAATHLINNGAELNDVRKFLGQKDIRSTLVYAEMSSEVLNTKILSITNKKKNDQRKAG